MGVPLGVVFPHPLSEQARVEDPSRRASRKTCEQASEASRRANRMFASPGAKPSSTSAVVFRPLFSSGVLRKGAGDDLISIVCQSRRSISIHVPTWGTTRTDCRPETGVSYRRVPILILLDAFLLEHGPTQTTKSL